MVIVSDDRNRIYTTNVSSATVSIIERGSVSGFPTGRGPAPVDWHVTIVPVGRGAEGFDISPDGKEMWGRWVYREIVKPERLLFVASFSDEKGGLTRHPLAPSWPLEMLSTITFAEQGGKTAVTVRWAAINATEAERKTFEAGQDSMQQGWSGTFEQLTACLAKEKA